MFNMYLHFKFEMYCMVITLSCFNDCQNCFTSYLILIMLIFLYTYLASRWSEEVPPLSHHLWEASWKWECLQCVISWWNAEVSNFTYWPIMYMYLIAGNMNWPNVVLTLGQHCRRWASNKSALILCFVCAGKHFLWHIYTCIYMSHPLF